MKILIIHQNFPGQYKHIAPYLSSNSENEVIAITDKKNDPGNRELFGIKLIGYSMPSKLPSLDLDPVSLTINENCTRGKKVYDLCIELKKEGFYPDLILMHPGWGDGFFLRELFSKSKIICYAEYFRKPDLLHFDSELESNKLQKLIIKASNISDLAGIHDADWAMSPTFWQKSTFPHEYHSKISVVFDGVNSNHLSPNSSSFFKIPNTGIVLDRTKKVVTYVNSGLEPIRGYKTFVRSIPIIQSAHPDSHIVIIGENKQSYWSPINWEEIQIELEENLSKTNLKNVHFLGKIAYEKYIQILQLSKAHVYLTMPFVPSWSLFEAMSIGCPIVASNTLPLLEVINNKFNGILVDFFSPLELAESVNKLLIDDDMSNILGQRARSTIIERYDLHRVCLPQQMNIIKKVTGLL